MIMKQLYAIFFALTALLCSCQKSGDEGVSVPIHVTQSIDAKSEVIDTDDLSSEQIKEYPVKGVFLNSIDDFYYYPELDIADLKTKGIDFVNNTLAFLTLYLRLYAPAAAAMAVELFILLFFPVFAVWLIWHARGQGFRFSAGLRPGVDALNVFTSPVYSATVIFLVAYAALL